MLTKSSSESQVRQYNVSNALASARIEGVIPTKQLEKNLTDYVSGKKSITELIEETKQRFFTR
ncbi:antitoxin VbhA family protein [Polynucleobacter rarus]|jgi:hypothetical protein|uniref:antitoxin VbhA family protein n=1 Tax=Polynucleobacter rarus TaxID=556055 RepID=UPI000D3EA671|nr:antitoxin VbhA family protein [Polynucleobacter rarus]